MIECKHPNHYEQLRQASENLIKQELKIKELEQQNAELIEFIELLN